MIVSIDARRRLLRAGTIAAECEIGRGGWCAAAAKREGDGRTPVGRWPIRAALLRPDAGIAPPRSLPWRFIRRDDGWCDAAGDPAYNRAVRLPYPRSAEQMWRGDRAYDVVVVLAHNDRPPIAGLGSAIFLHLSEERPTAGCVAVSRGTMVALLAVLTAGDVVDID